MTTVVLQASITVRSTSYTVERTINNYTGSLFYLATIVCHFPPRAWNLGGVGYVTPTKQLTGPGTE
jgi:hypothetical protein